MSAYETEITSCDEGFIVPIGFGDRRVEAAKSLIEEQYGGDRSEFYRPGVLSLARKAYRRPSAYRLHETGDDADFEDCGCEGPGWFCTMARGPKVADAWFFDAVWLDLEEAAFDGEGETS